MTSPSSERNIASTLGKYRLIAELGTGGMANVFLAVMRGHGGFNKLVVLKVPRDEVTADPNLLAMFIDEARIAARLSHPNVVQTFEIIHEGGREIIVMEYLDGYTLHDALLVAGKSGTPLPQPLHLKVISEALTGLHYAHEAKDFDGSPLGLVHRDISPHNVFMTFDGQVKLLDFGIAKAAMQTHQTEFGTFKGKVRYMPREQLAGANMDRRTDVFAVGTMIWEAAVGQRLWRKKSDVEVMSAIIAGEVPMPHDVRPDVPPALDAICRKAMAHDKRDRYETCLDLQADLERYLAEQPQQYTLREMVAFMEKLFAEQRASRQKVIDEQLRAANLQSSAANIPLASLPPPSVQALPTLSSPSATGTPVTVSGTDDRFSAVIVAPPHRGRAAAYAGVALLAAFVLGGGAWFARRQQLFGRAAPTPSVSTGTALPSAIESAPTVTPPPSAPPSAPPPAVPSSAPKPSATVAEVKSSRPPWHPPPVHTVSTAAPTRTAPPLPTAAQETPGVLSFTTYPWTRVYDGAKLLGTTPLYRVPLSPGTHVLTLENPEQGVKTTYTVTIKSGESVNRSVALK